MLGGTVVSVVRICAMENDTTSCVTQYRLVATATDAADNRSRPQRVQFKIVAGRPCCPNCRHARRAAQ